MQNWKLNKKINIFEGMKVSNLTWESQTDSN